MDKRCRPGILPPGRRAKTTVAKPRHFCALIVPSRRENGKGKGAKGDFVDEKRLRVAGYPRVSTEEQRIHGVSIAAQEDALRQWAADHNYDYVGSYNDAGISARSRYTKRPALLRLLEDVRAGKIDLIIFTKLDRWFRNVADYYEVQRVLDQYHVPWKAIWEDYETETASGRLKVNIMLSVAQDEADRTGERVKRSIEYRWAAGEVAQRLPIGYRREGKTVVYDETARPGVEDFFAVFLDTGNVGRARAAAALRGVHISRTSAGRILRSPFYTGTVRGISVPSYISQAEFELIQRRVALYNRTPAPNRVYLFSGLLICAHCGSRMGGRTTKQTQYYTCYNYLRHDGCPREARAYANERKLETWLLEHLDGILGRQIELAKVSAPRAQKEKPKKEALAKKLERIKNLYIDGDISRGEYVSLRDDIAKQMQSLPERRAVERLESLLPENWQEIYSDLSREGKRAFWCRTIKQINISPTADPEVIFFA